MAALTISAKNLGDFAVPGACPRCQWVKLRVKPLPYQTFPGIFSSIDVYNKRVVHQYHDREGRMPRWLDSLGHVKGYVEPPSYRKFSFHNDDLNVTIRGAADGIFEMADGSYTIVDYKTSRYTPGQERLMPIYQAQLNAYAYLGNRLGFHPVSQIALVYMEPCTGEVAAANPQMVNGLGFTMELQATIVPVDLDPEGTIPALMARAKEVFDMAGPPEPNKRCRECPAVFNLAALAGRQNGLS